MNNPSVFGVRLAQLIERLRECSGFDVSAAQIAKKIGVNAVTISNLLTGKTRFPSFEQAYKISRFFQVDMEFFLRDEHGELP